ncbi:MAG: polyhydroxyalkanoate depolymerase [Alphaproteobacteria bacterium]|nr:polyhydroxyalkanoate depolymerase [Alphaproteobacteria bacterium]
MLYQLHELQHLLLSPLRVQSKLMRSVFQNPLNPLAYTPIGRTLGAIATMTERITRRFARPEFGLHETKIAGKTVTVTEKVVLEKSFCALTHFKRSVRRKDPKILLVAPMSGHYATLLRGTVEALLPHHDVYITDWEDARQVPVAEGRFNFDDYVAYLIEFMEYLGPETHIMAVCQPAVPVLASVSLMASDNNPNQPLTMTLMGGPIDTRVSKTEVTELAETRPLDWFEQTVVHNVPLNYPGANRRVYPGFLQLSGFMSMNLDAHVGSHMQFFRHLVTGDGESSDKHQKFYNEYLAVMDIPAEFYLQTVEEVFQKHSLPKGCMKWCDPKTGELKSVRPQDIKQTALLTIEGELDDISARGQTTAAHNLCFSLPQLKQYHHFQLKTGHYGIFNGSRYREEIMPRIRHFIRKFDKDKDSVPEYDLEITPDLKPDRFDIEKHGIVAIRRWLKENQPESYKNTRIKTNTVTDNKTPPTKPKKKESAENKPSQEAKKNKTTKVKKSKSKKKKEKVNAKKKPNLKVVAADGSMQTPPQKKANK